jgi:hypothetical protein
MENQGASCFYHFHCSSEILSPALEEVIATWHILETHAVAPELIALRREALVQAPRVQQRRARCAR